MRVFVFIIALMPAAVGHVHMAVNEKPGVVFVHQVPEDLKALMREIAPVVERKSGRVGQQNVESVIHKKL